MKCLHAPSLEIWKPAEIVQTRLCGYGTLLLFECQQGFLSTQGTRFQQASYYSPDQLSKDLPVQRGPLDHDFYNLEIVENMAYQLGIVQTQPTLITGGNHCNLELFRVVLVCSTLKAAQNPTTKLDALSRLVGL